MNNVAGRPARAPWIVSTLVALIVVVALGVVPAATAQGSGPAESDRALRLFQQVYAFIQDNYVDQVDPSVLIEGAMRGMFESLGDPHSAYLSSDDMRSLTDTTSGSFGGVGMYINKPARVGEPTFVEVVAPIEDTPAFRAGLRAGDKLVAVSGDSTADLSVDEVVDRLRGRPGSEVEVLIRRGRDLEFTVVLERAVIQVPTVKWEMIGSVGFLRIIQFTPFTAQRVRDAVRDFEAANYSSLIVDVRTNPGGLLNAVVDVADLFFSDGLIVETRGRVRSENVQFRARSGVLIPPALPVVVLINDGSASASEILAGALKDRGRATLIGQTTYGKGSVQQVRNLGDSGFRLTMARYFTPAGNNIDKVGVSPDIEVIDARLSEEEEASYVRLRNENRIRDFVAAFNDPTPAQIERFIATQRADGIVLNDRWVRRLVRIEVNRVQNRSEVYDLEYDVQLRAAIEHLKTLGVQTERR